jgi:hypothetical protein
MTKPKPLSSKEEAQKLGLPTISAFFPILRKPGRPKKSSDEQPNTNKEGRGRPPKDARNEAVLVVYYDIDIDYNGADPKLTKPKLVSKLHDTIANDGIGKILQASPVRPSTPPAVARAPSPEPPAFMGFGELEEPLPPLASNAKTTGLETESI